MVLHYESIRSSANEFYTLYEAFQNIDTAYEINSILYDYSLGSIVHILNSGLSMNGHLINGQAFDKDRYINENEKKFLQDLHIIFSNMNLELSEFNNLQEKNYDELYLIIIKHMDIIAYEYSFEMLENYPTINGRN